MSIARCLDRKKLFVNLFDLNIHNLCDRDVLNILNLMILLIIYNFIHYVHKMYINKLIEKR